MLRTEKVEIPGKKIKGKKHTHLRPGDNHLSTFSIISAQSLRFLRTETGIALGMLCESRQVGPLGRVHGLGTKALAFPGGFVP